MSHIYHIFIFYVPWHPNLAPMSVGLSLNQWPGTRGDRGTAPRFVRARGKAWKMAPRGWISTAWWWLEHEMRRNDEPTRYGLLMLIGYISIDTIVDGILIYDSTCLHHFYITGWWWLEPWNLMTFHILGIVTPTDELIFFRGVGIPPTRYFIGV